MSKSYSAPFGNIFAVQTPALNQLSDRLYAEQRQRELYQQQQNKMLDDEFARNLSGIRDADIGDLTKAYGEFKLANQSLMKQKNGATPEQQLEVLRKKAAVYDVINNSKNFRQNFETPIQQGLNKNADHYQTDAHGRLIETMKTPYSKLNDEQKDPNKYIYTPTADFTKDLNGAWGTKQNAEYDRSTQGALQKTIDIYSRFNDPFTAYNKLIGGLTDERKKDEFIKTHQLSPDQEQYYTERFNQMVNDPIYQKIHGLTGNETFIGEDTDLGKAAKAAIMMSIPKPVLTLTKTPTQQQETIDYKDKLQRERMDKADLITMKHIDRSNYYKSTNPEVIDKNASGYVRDDTAWAKDHNGTVSLPMDNFKALFGRNPNKNDVVKVDNNSNYTLYSKKYDANADKYVDDTPIPLTKDQALIKYKRFLHTGLSGTDSKGNTPPTTKPKVIKHTKGGAPVIGQ